jgi:hypothetical protein
MARRETRANVCASSVLPEPVGPVMLVTETPAYEQAINYCKKNIGSVASIFFRLDFILHDHFFGADPRSIISRSLQLVGWHVTDAARGGDTYF